MESLTRRRWLGALGLGALGLWASAARGTSPSKTAGPSLVVLWLRGGPSQLETFDPKPGTSIGGPTRGIATSVRGVELAEGMPKTAEILDRMVLLRAVSGKEGDHERAITLMTTGYRPDPSVPRPSIGAICAHELPNAELEIPSYVSILGDGVARQGGYFGAGLDPFVIGDPDDPIPDVRARVDADRYDRRLEDLSFVEADFAAKHPDTAAKARHAERTRRALATMRSEDLAAFSIDDEPTAVLDAYGRTPFGRGCLAARRLVEAGVRSVEVTLSGWDTHIDHFDASRPLVQTLDDALSALVRDLEARAILDRTLILCAGEFGRTPRINATEGRDHWPDAFSVALAGGGLPRGVVLGETSREDGTARETVPVADVGATVLAALGIDPELEVETELGRPVKLSEGKPIAELVRRRG